MQKLIIFIVTLLYVSLSHADSKKSCGEFEKVIFSPVKNYTIRRAEVGSYRLDAGDTPPLIFNKDTGKSCTADADIVAGDDGDVYWLKKANRILYRSYSGSEQWVTLVDAKTCKTLWKSIANIGNQVKSSSIEINPDCGSCEESGNFNSVCECQSAEVWRLTPDCGLKRDDLASKKLTKQLLRVAFVDKRKVKGAKTSSAKLVQ